MFLGPHPPRILLQAADINITANLTRELSSSGALVPPGLSLGSSCTVPGPSFNPFPYRSSYQFDNNSVRSHLDSNVLLGSTQH